jgi:hypothetical protein
VKPVLQAFLYTDRIPPNGALWFDETLGGNCEWDDAELSLRLGIEDLDDKVGRIPKTDERAAALTHFDLAVI